MAPIRRYLRISKYTVLECRIYLENPAETRWLLDSNDPILPRIFAAIRPLVLPKLREENERLSLRKKGKPVKDVITQEDFDVAMFLRESRTRHSLLTRHKEFETSRDMQAQTGLASGLNDGADARILIESDSESGMDIRDIPQEATAVTDDIRGKQQGNSESQPDLLDGQRPKRKRGEAPPETSEKDEKKMRFQTIYDGFNIHGWMLCLLVTRKGGKGKTRAAPLEHTRQVLMEEWMSTQAQGDLDEE